MLLLLLQPLTLLQAASKPTILAFVEVTLLTQGIHSKSRRCCIVLLLLINPRAFFWILIVLIEIRVWPKIGARRYQLLDLLELGQNVRTDAILRLALGLLLV